MYVNLYGNSTAYQTLYMLQGEPCIAVVHSTLRLRTGTGSHRSQAGPVHQAPSAIDLCGTDDWVDRGLDLQLHQYAFPPLVFSLRGNELVMPVMKSIVTNNREVLKNPVGTRVVRLCAKYCASMYD